VVIFDNSVGPSSTAPLLSPPPSSAIPNRKSGIRNRNNRRVFNRFHFSNRKYSLLLHLPRRIAIHLDRTGRSILSTNNFATGFRQGTASAVPLHARAPGVLTPEACFRRLLGSCLRDMAVASTQSSLITRSSRGDSPWWTTHLSPLVARHSSLFTHHFFLIAGSAIRNQNNLRDYTNFHFSNRR
jgi:hypothetical protein